MKGDLNNRTNEKIRRGCSMAPLLPSSGTVTAGAWHGGDCPAGYSPLPCHAAKASNNVLNLQTNKLPKPLLKWEWKLFCL